jgi:hypothetical protein
MIFTPITNAKKGKTVVGECDRKKVRGHGVPLQISYKNAWCGKGFNLKYYFKDSNFLMLEKFATIRIRRK